MSRKAKSHGEVSFDHNTVGSAAFHHPFKDCLQYLKMKTNRKERTQKTTHMEF